MSRMQRGFCLEEDMQNLFYTENFKTLTAGVQYRRCGTDVELYISTSETIPIKASQNKELRNFTRTDMLLLRGLALVAEAFLTNKEKAKRLQVNISSVGKVMLQNVSTENVEIEAIRFYIKYSIL